MRIHPTGTAAGACAALLVSAAAVGSAGAVSLEGRGSLRAAGFGTANVRGTGQVTYRLHGSGVLVIRNASRVRVKVEGQGRRRQVGDALVITGLEGRAVVRGRHLDTTFHGGKVRLTARGKGVAVLRGRGKYQVKGGSPKPWPATPEAIRF